MKDVIINALGIVGACLAIAVAAVALVLFRPAARRRRRRKRHARRPRIDLFVPAGEDRGPKSDA